MLAFFTVTTVKHLLSFYWTLKKKYLPKLASGDSEDLEKIEIAHSTIFLLRHLGPGGRIGNVDNFFDNVMVMDKDPRIKENRLSMLAEIKNLFFKIADFSKLSD